MNLNSISIPDWVIPQSGNLVVIVDLSQIHIPTPFDWLNSQEQKRYQQVCSPDQQARYLKIRGLLRIVLAQKLRCNPNVFTFEINRSGKPFLKDQHLHFNLTHSENWLAIMLSKHPCGIDIEKKVQRKNLTSLVKRFFCENEYQTFEENNDQFSLFTNWWTTKEAVLKAYGSGIAGGLHKLDLCEHTHQLNQASYQIELIQPKPELYLSCATENATPIENSYFVLQSNLEITPLMSPYKHQLTLKPEHI